MAKAPKNATERYRKRVRQKGIARIEVQVPREDAEPVKILAGLLRSGDPALVKRARRRLVDLAEEVREEGRLKELLAAAPLEGVEIERSRDVGRLLDLL